MDNEDYAIFTATFGQPIYAKDTLSSSPKPLNDVQYKGIVKSQCSDGIVRKNSAISTKVGRVFNIVCKNLLGNSITIYTAPITNLCSNIPSAAAILPTANPGGSFLNLLKGGLTVNETAIPDTIAIAYQLKPADKTFFERSTSCSFVASTTRVSAFTNSAGEVIHFNRTSFYL